MNKQIKYFLCITAVIVALFSCSTKKEKDENRRALARVNNSYLYEDEIKNSLPYGISSKDSVAFVKKYIDSWIRETLVVQKAENNLPEDKKNVEKQLQDYKNSLIIYAYEKELVSQKLDTVVTDAEIEEYYNTNKPNFELKDNIIRVRYIKVNKNAPEMKKVQHWYQADDPKEKELLESYCHQFAANYYLDDTSWLFFDDLLKEVPIQTYNKEAFLQNNRLVEVSDSLFNYFINIKDFRVRNSLSPISFEKENIKNIILNKRKLQLISKMKEDIYAEAWNNNKIEIFNDENFKK